MRRGLDPATEAVMASISPTTRRLLDIQGFDGVDDHTLADTAPWLRLAFGLCTLLAALGTVRASPGLLFALVPIAVLGAAFPVHPFDLVYNLGVRHLTGTGPLPRRGAPSRFACGLGAVWLLAVGFAFLLGADLVGYVLGGMLVAMGTLVSTIHVCIPSLVYRSIFGFPAKVGCAADDHPARPTGSLGVGPTGA